MQKTVEQYIVSLERASRQKDEVIANLTREIEELKAELRAKRKSPAIETGLRAE